MPLRTMLTLVILGLLATLAAMPQMPTQEHWDVWKSYHTRADSAHGFDVLSYDLVLTIDDAQEWIQGTVMATVAAEETLNEIAYELELLDVTAVRVNGQAAAYTYDDHLITIDLPGIPTGQTFTTEVDYEGNPVLSNDVYHEGMLFMGGYLFTLSDPSGVRWWMPAYDHPWDKAEVDYTITMRDDWVVACNGIRTGIVDNGDDTATTTWDGSNPIAPHVFVIHGGPFLEHEQQAGVTPIHDFIPQAYYTNAIEDLSNMPFMIETFEALYGPYPFEKYGNVVLGMQTFGAMEHQTMTTLGSSFIDGNHGGERIIAHELAHQWFGNCLTPLTWVDVWLSEGFATYSEALYTQAWLGWEESVDYVTTEIMNYYRNWAAGSGPQTIYDPVYNQFFYPPQYEKAASVLHMLRLEVGDDTFFEILQTWFTTYHNGWVVTQDFVSMVNQVTGGEYDWLFNQWIYGEGMPAVDYAFFFHEDDPGQFRCSAVTQGNGDTDFDLHVPVVFENTAGDRDSVLVTAEPEIVAYEYDAPFADWTEINIDPNSWVLVRYHDVHLPELVGAYAADGAVMLQWLQFWPDLDIGYNIYRADNPEGPFERVNDLPVEDTAYTDNSVSNGQTYYYAISAVLDDVWETQRSDVLNAEPMEFPLDRGVLLVDETLDGNGATPISPTDEMVDAFYAGVVNNAYRAWDYAAEGIPPLDTLACYSTVFWIDDDITQHHIDDNLQSLGNYVLGGGNLVVSGWKTAQELPSNFLTTFLYDTPVQMWTQAYYTGAVSASYPALTVDPDKMLSPWNGHLAYACTFPEAAAAMYTFEGESDPVGQPCALKTQPGGAFVLFGFPLYFQQPAGVESLCDALLTEFGETVSVSPDPLPQVALSVWPNPLRPGLQNLSVRLSLPQQSVVEAGVYNIRGRRVATLASETLPAGEHSLSWNCRDRNDKPVASGIYLLHVKHGDSAQTRKVLLLR
ncbi:MAG: T9SS type A sorting domain-containing protein [Candidatus Cloacimonetes bacterium]|nr:T9SS type A sorting domain-containing protein [Candidatus Cloacimonadota bacterium]